MLYGMLTGAMVLLISLVLVFLQEQWLNFVVSLGLGYKTSLVLAFIPFSVLFCLGFGVIGTL